jgi:hypothetical protein
MNLSMIFQLKKVSFEKKVFRQNRTVEENDLIMKLFLTDSFLKLNSLQTKRKSDTFFSLSHILFVSKLK